MKNELINKLKTAFSRDATKVDENIEKNYYKTPKFKAGGSFYKVNPVKEISEKFPEFRNKNYSDEKIPPSARQHSVRNLEANETDDSGDAIDDDRDDSDDENNVTDDDDATFQDAVNSSMPSGSSTPVVKAKTRKRSRRLPFSTPGISKWELRPRSAIQKMGRAKKKS